MRKIIQIGCDRAGTIHALCDDGSLWVLLDRKWLSIPMPSIPEYPKKEVFMRDLPDNPNRNKIEDIKWS
jgi:hypothetical protein